MQNLGTNHPGKQKWRENCNTQALMQKELYLVPGTDDRLVCFGAVTEREWHGMRWWRKPRDLSHSTYCVVVRNLHFTPSADGSHWRDIIGTVWSDVYVNGILIAVWGMHGREENIEMINQFKSDYKYCKQEMEMARVKLLAGKIEMYR